MTTEAAAPQSTWAEHEQYKKPWYWYDWANSAFVTTVGTVLFAPYLTTVAKEAACPGLDEDASCHVDLHVIPAAADLPSGVWQVALVLTLLGLGALVLTVVQMIRNKPALLPTAIPLAVAAVGGLVLVLTAPLDPGSVASYTVTLATIISAVLLVFVGAIADRTPRPARLLGGFAWAGAAAASLLFFLHGGNWRFGAAMMILATIALGSSLVVYDAILCRIASPDEREAAHGRDAERDGRRQQGRLVADHLDHAEHQCGQTEERQHQGELPDPARQVGRSRDDVQVDVTARVIVESGAGRLLCDRGEVGREQHRADRRDEGGVGPVVPVPGPLVPLVLGPRRL